jgi:hypothetical protein
MPKFTSFFSAGIALVALALAAPAAQAQTSDFVSISLASNVPTLTSNQPLGLPASSETVQRLSAPVAPADYFNDSHKDLKQALTWMQETNALHAEYQTMYAEARIRLQLKDYAGAHATALKAKKMSLAASNSEYARHSEEVIAQAQAKLK